LPFARVSKEQCAIIHDTNWRPHETGGPALLTNFGEKRGTRERKGRETKINEKQVQIEKRLGKKT